MTTERERFEAWAEQNVGQPDFGGYHTDGGRWFYRHNFIRMCWDAWQAALAHARSAEPPAERQRAEPVAWCVFTEDGPDYCAGYREACHEHINDAINEHKIEGAEKWRVVPLYAAPSLAPAKQMTEADVEVLMNHVRNSRQAAMRGDWDDVRYSDSAIEEHLMQFVGSAKP